MATKRLMVLGAGIANKASLVEISKLNGIDLIVLDANAKSIGKRIAKHFECIDITNRDTVLAAATKHKIDGIFSLNDHGIRSAAFTADVLGLRGMSMATANAALDKGAMREVWKAAGIPQPDFRIILSQNEISEFADEVGYPIVIKPVDCGGGGRGVFVIRSSEYINKGFEFASPFLNRNNRLIIENFIEGTETSVEVVRIKGRTHIVAFSDKKKAPYFSRVATEISYPGRFIPETIKRIREISDKIMRSLGLGGGVGHIEYIVTEDGSVFVLEIGSRVGGGHTFHPIASYVSGINYPEWIARFYLGDAETPSIESYRGACYSFFYANRPGTLINITGLEVARGLPNIHSVECWKQPGEHVSVLENSMERVGCIVSLAETREEAVTATKRAKDAIRLDIKGDKKFLDKLDRIL